MKRLVLIHTGRFSSRDNPCKMHAVFIVINSVRVYLPYVFNSNPLAFLKYEST